MKKGLTLVFTAFLNAMVCFSQSVFPESDAIWNYHQYANGSLLNGWMYGLSGDTIIDQVSYSKFYLLNDASLQIDEKDTYLGGFRQADKQVWFRPAACDNYGGDFNREFLLYDFGKDVGESIGYDYIIYQSTSYPEFCQGGVLFVDSDFPNRFDRKITDTQETIFGRKITMDDSWECIEGVGSLAGIYGDSYQIPSCCHPSYEMHLARFVHHDEVKYLYEGYNEFYCAYGNKAGLHDESVTKTPVAVSFDGAGIEIHAHSSLVPFSFELIDATGRILNQQWISSAYYQLPFDNNHTVLFYRIKGNESSVVTGKIVRK